MLPITLLLGKRSDIWIEATLAENRRCAFFTENPGPLRSKFADHAIDWRLMPLCKRENENFREFHLRSTTSGRFAARPIHALLQSAIDYIGVPSAIVVTEIQVTEDVTDYISIASTPGLERLTFVGISEVALKNLGQGGFTRITRLNARRPEGEESNTTRSIALSPSGSVPELLTLFAQEVLCAWR